MIISDCCYCVSLTFTRVCSNVSDFNNRNYFLTAKLLKQGYRFHKIRIAFSLFYQRHLELIVKDFCFVALRPKSTAMVIAGRSVHLTPLFPGQA